MAEGFKIPRRTALITFEGTDYDGAEIRCALDVNLQTLLWFQRKARAFVGQEPDVINSPDDLEEAAKRFGAEILDSWNLDDDEGNRLPANSEGLLMLPAALCGLLLVKWVEAVAEVPLPLGQPSPDGGPSEVLSTPTGNE